MVRIFCLIITFGIVIHSEVYADSYYPAWETALHQLMLNGDKFAGFEYSASYVPGGSDCWDRFMGVSGGSYYYPNAFAVFDEACVPQYAAKGISPSVLELPLISDEFMDALLTFSDSLTAFPGNAVDLVRALAGVMVGYLLILACIRG